MSGQGGDAAIEAEGVRIRFGDQIVIGDVGLQVKKGEILALIGSSGSGKTTLLHAITGLLNINRGRIRVLGEWLHELDAEALRTLSRRWGILFQQGALFSGLDIFENVAFPLRELARQGEPLDERAVEELVYVKLDMVGLRPAVARKMPSELSGGMIKRAALARSLALEGELLFLDEPTTGLDPISARALDELLIELHQELELSAFMISHDLHSLAALADRVAVLDQGELLTVGAFSEVARYDHPFIQEFFKRRPGDDALLRLAD